MKPKRKPAKPTTEKPDHEGCFRVEYEPETWCWMITQRERDMLWYESTEHLPTIYGASYMRGFVRHLDDNLRYIEVFPPESEV